MTSGSGRRGAKRARCKDRCRTTRCGSWREARGRILLTPDQKAWDRQAPWHSASGALSTNPPAPFLAARHGLECVHEEISSLSHDGSRSDSPGLRFCSGRRCRKHRGCCGQRRWHSGRYNDGGRREQWQRVDACSFRASGNERHIGRSRSFAQRSRRDDCSARRQPVNANDQKASCRNDDVGRPFVIHARLRGRN